jgi:iron complex transport system substrate-binding protein
MSTEMILTRAPEVLIQLHYGAEMPASRVEEERRVWSGLPALPAVKNNRVYVLFGDEFVVPGPRIAQAAERLARTLHPDLFP